MSTESRKLSARLAAVKLENALADASAAGLTVTIGASGAIYLWDSADWNTDTGLPVSMTSTALARLERENGVWNATWDQS